MLATISKTIPYQSYAESSTRPELVVTQMLPEHLAGVERISAPVGSDSECFSRKYLSQILERYPEGQFVALRHGQVVSYALTMRTHRSPGDVPLQWMDAIGDMTLRHHQPAGEWLYGVDFAVDPSARRMGIGSKMYKARFDFVKRLNLRGMYAGGMLMGYHRYQDQMMSTEYAHKVITGELEDPTVSMQMKRGFRPRAVIEQYSELPQAGSCAVLIEWQNPQYRPMLTALPPVRSAGSMANITAAR